MKEHIMENISEGFFSNNIINQTNNQIFQYRKIQNDIWDYLKDLFPKSWLEVDQFAAKIFQNTKDTYNWIQSALDMNIEYDIFLPIWNDMVIPKVVEYISQQSFCCHMICAYIGNETAPKLCQQWQDKNDKITAQFISGQLHYLLYQYLEDRTFDFAISEHELTNSLSGLLMVGGLGWWAKTSWNW